MIYLKLTQRIYVGYTGVIAGYNFVNGISTEPIPEVERIRIAGNINAIEVDADGNEGVNPSPSASVVANQNTRAELRSLPRQSDIEKLDENVQAVMGNEKLKPLYSAIALDKIATLSGIAGLRDVAADWKVKSKSIPVLMQMILDAQEDYVVRQREVLKGKGVPVDEINALLALVDDFVPAKIEPKQTKIVQAVVTPKEVAEMVAIDAVATAAATGDLAAALTAAAVDEVDDADADLAGGAGDADAAVEDEAEGADAQEASGEEAVADPAGEVADPTVAEAADADQTPALIEIVEADRPE